MRASTWRSSSLISDARGSASRLVVSSGDGLGRLGKRGLLRIDWAFMVVLESDWCLIWVLVSRVSFLSVRSAIGDGYWVLKNLHNLLSLIVISGIKK